MWFTAVRSFAEELDASLEVNVTAGCSILIYDGGRACNQHREAVLQRLSDQPPDIVVLVDYSRLSLERSLSIPKWERALERTLDRLTGSTVLLFGESPRPNGNAPSCLAQNLQDVRPCEPKGRDPIFREFVERGQAAAVRAGASFVDLSKVMCPRGSCPTVMGDRLVYTDSDHVSESFVRLVRPKVVGLMRAALRGQ